MDRPTEQNGRRNVGTFSAIAPRKGDPSGQDVDNPLFRFLQRVEGLPDEHCQEFFHSCAAEAILSRKASICALTCDSWSAVMPPAAIWASS